VRRALRRARCRAPRSGSARDAPGVGPPRSSPGHLPRGRGTHAGKAPLRESGGEASAEAERVPSDQELTFGRLFPEANEGTGVPRHVVLKKDSTVEVLAAKIKLSWDDSRDVIFFGVDDQDPWLKVRIDGPEGWIHTQRDFSAVGVPQAG
jgi:hypothetical protein